MATVAPGEFAFILNCIEEETENAVLAIFPLNVKDSYKVWIPKSAIAFLGIDQFIILKDWFVKKDNKLRSLEGMYRRLAGNFIREYGRDTSYGNFALEYYSELHHLLTNRKGFETRLRDE